MSQPALHLSDDKTKQLSRLIVKSHESYMDLNSILDWERGADRTIAPKREDHSWIYGTEYWDALNAEQRIELLWLENAQTPAGFIWLEEGLSPLFIRILHNYEGKIPDAIREYMMIFCKEEIVHTQMFRRYLKLAGLPVYKRPEMMDFIAQVEKMHPIVGILCTYLLEATAEEQAMRQEGPGIDPLTRQLYSEHHREEARHLAFGKWVCESFFEKASAQTKMMIGGVIRPCMSEGIPRFTYNPEISQYLSFDIGIDPNDTAEIARIRLSDNNRRLNAERYGPMLAWIKKLGIVDADYDWFDPVTGPPEMTAPPPPMAMAGPA
ncbi:MAG: diiron oxygenase [Thermoanaerobaculia bacterium]